MAGPSSSPAEHIPNVVKGISAAANSNETVAIR